jgi:hypothetical protein
MTTKRKSTTPTKTKNQHKQKLQQHQRLIVTTDKNDIYKCT